MIELILFIIFVNSLNKIIRIVFEVALALNHFSTFFIIVDKINPYSFRQINCLGIKADF